MIWALLADVEPHGTARLLAEWSDAIVALLIGLFTALVGVVYRAATLAAKQKEQDEFIQSVRKSIIPKLGKLDKDLAVMEERLSSLDGGSPTARFRALKKLRGE